LYTPASVAFDLQGRVYIANMGNGTVIQIPAGCNAASDPPCTTQTTANESASPNSVAVDASGSIYITQTNSNEVTEVPWVRVIAAYGTPKPLLSDLSNPKSVTVDARGNIYIADTGNNRVLKVTPQNSGQPTTYRLRGGSPHTRQ
jgi:sugar lactone lactonase YvrE